MSENSWTGSKNTTPLGDVKLRVQIFFIFIKNSDNHNNNNEGIVVVLKPRKHRNGQRGNNILQQSTAW